ncbi:sulfite exporter TauE/SafE family protein [Methanocaldococcus sp.]|uniref:sulfite exporter TauE/SafE family protein n=1 Tax=Methanocaldococcus sp. TaxID=2152917 RepID=UPI00260BC584|nr:sulfite exporter TauE/SafE family protein [Methanocaldococcus sp.]MCQ6254483.1 sulfite exporter TauE/SafE family protein [Methanocaldococcus sp.]
MSLYFIFIGFVVGYLVGLTGIGGGILMTPLLIFLGVEPIIAVGTDLLYAAITKIVGTILHNKRRNINYNIAIKLFLGSLPAIIIGSIILRLVNRCEINYFLTIILGVILIITSIINLKGRFVKKIGFNSSILVFIGFIVGLIVQFTSVGSGVLITLALTNFTKLSPRSVVGTSIFYGVLLTSLSALSHISLGNVDYKLALSLILGTIPGVYVGTHMNSYISQDKLRKFINFLILFMGIYILGVNLLKYF